MSLPTQDKLVYCSHIFTLSLHCDYSPKAFSSCFCSFSHWCRCHLFPQVHGHRVPGCWMWPCDLCGETECGHVTACQFWAKIWRGIVCFNTLPCVSAITTKWACLGGLDLDTEQTQILSYLSEPAQLNSDQIKWTLPTLRPMNRNNKYLLWATKIWVLYVEIAVLYTLSSVPTRNTIPIFLKSQTISAERTKRLQYFSFIICTENIHCIRFWRYQMKNHSMPISLFIPQSTHKLQFIKNDNLIYQALVLIISHTHTHPNFQSMYAKSMYAKYVCKEVCKHCTIRSGQKSLRNKITAVFNLSPLIFPSYWALIWQQWWSIVPPKGEEGEKKPSAWNSHEFCSYAVAPKAIHHTWLKINPKRWNFLNREYQNWYVKGDRLSSVMLFKHVLTSKRDSNLNV